MKKNALQTFLKLATCACYVAGTSVLILAWATKGLPVWENFRTLLLLGGFGLASFFEFQHFLVVRDAKTLGEMGSNIELHARQLGASLREIGLLLGFIFIAAAGLSNNHGVAFKLVTVCIAVQIVLTLGLVACRLVPLYKKPREAWPTQSHKLYFVRSLRQSGKLCVNPKHPRKSVVNLVLYGSFILAMPFVATARFVGS